MIFNNIQNLKLRWYQEEAVSAYWEFLMSHKGDFNSHPLLVLPTGTGKSIIIAKIIKELQEKYPKTARVAMLTHNTKLVEQNAQKIKSIMPFGDIGYCCGSLKKRQINNQIVCGTIQSFDILLRRYEKANALEYIKPFNLLIIDEAHLLSDKEDTRYRNSINILKKINNRLRVVGLTATPFRLNSGLLTEQENAIFTNIAYDLNNSFQRLINEGYLSRLITLKTKHNISVEGIKTTRGDFDASQLEELLSDESKLKEILFDSINIAVANKREHWICFISGIKNSELVEKILQENGVKAVAVHSKLSNEFNDRAISAFNKGEITCLISADKLTTGFDSPHIDMIIFLRPTISTALYVQCLGRGTRPAEGKKDCLVLDYAQNYSRHGPINRIDLKKITKKRKPKDLEKIKTFICSKCGCYLEDSMEVCPQCGEPVSDLILNELNTTQDKKKEEFNYFLTTNVEFIAPDVAEDKKEFNLITEDAPNFPVDFMPDRAKQEFWGVVKGIKAKLDEDFLTIQIQAKAFKDKTHNQYLKLPIKKTLKNGFIEDMVKRSVVAFKLLFQQEWNFNSEEAKRLYEGINSKEIFKSLDLTFKLCYVTFIPRNYRLSKFNATLLSLVFYDGSKFKQNFLTQNKGR